jgi:hypothetical protein
MVGSDVGYKVGFICVGKGYERAVMGGLYDGGGGL